VKLNYIPGDANHRRILQAAETGEVLNFSVIWRSGTENTRANFAALVEQVGTTQPIDNVVMLDVNLNNTGPITFLNETDLALNA
jgi:hypothetical protein